MTIIATLGSVASTLVYSAIRSYTDASTGAQLHSEVSIAMERMVRELRRIEEDSALPGAQPRISSVSPTSIAWNGNWSLSLNGTDLELVEAGGMARVLQSGVTAFSIQTYNDANAALPGTLLGPACAVIQRIQLQLTASRQGATTTLRTKLFVRAVMDGA